MNLVLIISYNNTRLMAIFFRMKKYVRYFFMVHPCIVQFCFFKKFCVAELF